MNHSWLDPVLNLGLSSLNFSNFPVTLSVWKLGLSGWGRTMDREEDSSNMLVFSCLSWGVQPSLGTSCWAKGWLLELTGTVGEVAVSLQGRGAAG